MRRRDFLTCLMVMTAGQLVFRKSFASTKKKLYLQPFEEPRTKEHGFFIFDLVANQFKTISTKIIIHQIYYDEKNDLCVGINKYGPEFITFTLARPEDIKYHVLKDSRFVLSGHIDSSPIQGKYFVTAFMNEGYNSCILGIDKKNYKTELLADLGHSFPPVHDGKLNPEQNKFLATSSDKIHSLDLASGKLTSLKLKLSSKDSSLRHFTLNDQGQIALQANIISPEYSYFRGEIVFFDGESASTQLMGKQRIDLKDNELLDFVFHESGRSFSVLHGKSSSISFWDTHPLQLKKIVQFERFNRSITDLEGNLLVLRFDGLHHINVKTYEIKQIIQFKNPMSDHTICGHGTII